MRKILILVTVILAAGLVRSGDDPGSRYKKKTLHALETLVAPVALYPDPLLDMVLAASPFANDLVNAGDYLHGPGDKSAAWPAPVQQMLEYPNVLWSMDKHLSWTARLGNAWQHQKDDTKTAINTVRLHAFKAGNLVSTDFQTVEVNNDVVRIIPRDSGAMYVPHYSIYAIYYHHLHPVVAYATGKVAVEQSVARAHRRHHIYAYPQPQYHYAHGAEVHMNRPAYPTYGTHAAPDIYRPSVPTRPGYPVPAYTGNYEQPIWHSPDPYPHPHYHYMGARSAMR